MHIVYTLVNLTNINAGVKPYLYIGSKTNCRIENGKIYSLKSGTVYMSSSKSVKKSVNQGDEWSLLSWKEVEDKTKICHVEGQLQDSVCAKDNDIYYNLAHANLKFNSTGEATRKAISQTKKGKVRAHMLEPKYWERLQLPENRLKNSQSCTGNPNVIAAARKRSARLSKDPDYVKWRAELTSKTFKGRKATERELQLRRHDDRYKSGRKLSNDEVWSIRFGQYANLTLNELMTVYTHVSKATLSRVKCFKVFKDIGEDWKQ